MASKVLWTMALEGRVWSAGVNPYSSLWNPLERRRWMYKTARLGTRAESPDVRFFQSDNAQGSDYPLGAFRARPLGCIANRVA